jgi:hypothetical protein
MYAIVAQLLLCLRHGQMCSFNRCWLELTLEGSLCVQ